MTALRTSAADINRLSCSNGIWGLDEGSDHAQTLPAQPDLHDAALCPANPQSYAAILKICDGTRDLTLPAVGQGFVQIAQGMENSVDLNNGAANITIHGEFGWGGGSGDQVITIKGGCQNIMLWGILYSKGNEADITLDAWSDQSSALVSGINLSGLTRVDGQPITIILGRFGSNVAAYPASYRVLFWKSLAYRVYWLAKAAAVKLHLIKGAK